MNWIQICKAAGLGVTEIALVESYIEDDDGRFLETKAYEKLFIYFFDIGDMPYRVAKAIDLEPDIWILDRLASCKSPQTVV
jgi:enamine deaminase RidA (YjgF/YER057c/UK114 family)